MFSKKFLATLEAVIYVAKHSSVHPVSSKAICSSQGVQPRYLEQIMQKLVHHGIFKGSRGPKGGYTLANDKRKITLADILEAAEDINFADEDASKSSSDIHVQLIKPLCNKMKANIMQELKKYDLQYLCNECRYDSNTKNRSEAFDI